MLEHELDDAERGSRDYYAIRDDLIDVVKTANGKRAVWQSVPQSDYVALGSEVSVGRQASDSVAPVLPINPADVFRTTRRPFLVLDRFPVAFACPSLQPERPLLLCSQVRANGDLQLSLVLDCLQARFGALPASAPLGRSSSCVERPAVRRLGWIGPLNGYLVVAAWLECVVRNENGAPATALHRTSGPSDFPFFNSEWRCGGGARGEGR